MDVRPAIVISLLALVWGILPPLAAEAPGARASTLRLPLRQGRPGTRGAEPLVCVVSRGRVGPVCAVAFHPEGRALASGGYGEALLWDLSEARLSRRIGAGELSGSVVALAFAEGGSSIVVGGGSPGHPSAVKVFDVDSGSCKATLDGPDDAVYCLAVSPDGKLLAAGSADRKARVWGLPQWKPVATIEAHGGWVLATTFSGDGKILATAGADKTLNLWDVTTWERTESHRYAEPLHGVAFGPDGSLIAVAVGGSTERAVRTRRLPDAKNARAAYMGEGLPQALAWAKRGNRMYAASSDGTVRVFAGPDGRGGGAALEGHLDWVHAVALSPDEERIASGSADGTVRIWVSGEGGPRAPRAGRLLATLVQLEAGTDRWAIVTPPGFSSTSSPEAVGWERNGVATPRDRLSERFLDAAAVRRILASEDASPPGGTR